MSIVGVSGSLEVISKVELFDPPDVGLNETLMVKVLPGLIVLLTPPPLVIANIDTSVPVIDVDIKRSALPLFLTLKEAVLLFFISTFPKS